MIIRHEALFIDPGNDGVIAEVMESRLLGRASLIHLSVPTGRSEIHLHARIPWAQLDRGGKSGAGAG